MGSRFLVLFTSVSNPASDGPFPASDFSCRVLFKGTPLLYPTCRGRNFSEKINEIRGMSDLHRMARCIPLGCSFQWKKGTRSANGQQEDNRQKAFETFRFNRQKLREEGKRGEKMQTLGKVDRKSGKNKQKKNYTTARHGESTLQAEFRSDAIKSRKKRGDNFLLRRQ